MPNNAAPQGTPDNRRNSDWKAYAKYGGMAFQFLAACIAGALLGRWLDAQLQLARPLFAVFGTIGFMAVAFYSIYKQLLR